jgi:hypothetical protein
MNVFSSNLKKMKLENTFNWPFSYTTHEELNIVNILVKLFERHPSLCSNIIRLDCPGECCIGAETTVVSPAMDGMVPGTLNVSDLT